MKTNNTNDINKLNLIFPNSCARIRIAAVRAVSASAEARFSYTSIVRIAEKF